MSELTPETVIIGTLYAGASTNQKMADHIMQALQQADYKLVSRSALESDLRDAVEALSGDSNDAEHDALFNAAQSLAAYAGQDIDALMYPDDKGEDDE